MSNKLRLYLLCMSSGILTGVAWPFTGSLTPLIFLAWIPMLLAEWHVSSKMLRPRRLILPVYCGFVLFNFISTGWIYYASFGGMAMAVLVNSLLMTTTFYLFHLVHRRLGHFAGYAAFISLWMAFELGHYYWELSWPWLNMGNVFSIRTTWIQWYEYTGVSGGTLWILLVNLLFFITWQEYNLQKRISKKVITRFSGALLTIVIPVFISHLIYRNYEEKKDPIDVVVVQPNIDPYFDKFRGMNAFDQLSIFFRNAVRVGDSTAQFIVGPETVLPYTIVENTIDQQLKASDEDEGEEIYLNEFSYLRRIFTFMDSTEMFLGMSSKKYYANDENAPENAMPAEKGMLSEYYNATLYIEPGLSYQVYHKKHLVLGVEKIPFASWFPFLNELALSLGGSAQTMGASEGPDVVESRFTNAKITTAICYESVFGIHLAQATRKGANVIFVMTNDGWWDETAGYKQHFSYSRLRAIELRRSIARSANTGISGFIDQRGQVIKSSKWWEPTALRHSINLNNDLTFYARAGDVLYILASLLSLSIIAVWLYYAIRGKNATDSREI